MISSEISVYYSARWCLTDKEMEIDLGTTSSLFYSILTTVRRVARWSSCMIYSCRTLQN